MAINEITLGGYPVYEAPDGADINWFEMGSGIAISRAGTGKFLMARVDAAAISAGPLYASSVGTCPEVMLVMKSPSAGETFSIQVSFIGYHPFETVVRQDLTNAADYNTQDLVCVIVRDSRFRQSQIVPPASATGAAAKHFNTVVSGFVSDHNDYPAFIPSTLNGAAPWTWEEIMDTVLSGIGKPDSIPTWTPRNLMFRDASFGTVFDFIAENLYLVPGFTLATFLIPKMYAPGQTSALNTTTMTNAAQYKIDTGRTSRARRMPRKIMVSIPIVGGSFAESHTPGTASGYYTYAYTVPAPDNDGGTATMDCVCYPYYAVRDFSNNPEATDVAADIGARRYAWLKAVPDNSEYHGLWPFHVDGSIRRIRWESTKFGARTRIMLNCDNPFGVYGSTPGFADTMDSHYEKVVPANSFDGYSAKDTGSQRTLFGSGTQPFALVHLNTHYSGAGGVYWAGYCAYPSVGEATPSGADTSCFIHCQGSTSDGPGGAVSSGAVGYFLGYVSEDDLGIGAGTTKRPLFTVVTRWEKRTHASYLDLAANPADESVDAGTGGYKMDVVTKVEATGTPYTLKVCYRNIGINKYGEIIFTNATSEDFIVVPT